jgi:hypothetical protein
MTHINLGKKQIKEKKSDIFSIKNLGYTFVSFSSPHPLNQFFTIFLIYNNRFKCDINFFQQAPKKLGIKTNHSDYPS